MGGATHQLHSLTISGKEDCHDKSQCPLMPHFRSFSQDCSSNLRGASFRRRINNRRKPIQAPAKKLWKRNSKILHRHPRPLQDVYRKDQFSENDEAASAVSSLRLCTKNRDLHRGKRLHEDILEKGLLAKCCGALVTMYAKCGALTTAKALLDMHKIRDVIPWTALIAGYAREQRSQEALDCFECMQHEGLSPNAVTFACVLKACGTNRDADKGGEIHDEITRQGLLQNDMVLGNSLVDMYARSGALEKAERALEELPFRDVVSWNTLITAYAQRGESEQALSCFERMRCEGISPNAVTYACILKACGSKGLVDKGRKIHDEIVRRGLIRNDVVLGNALVDMYAKCGALAQARRTLEELSSRDVITWNALITGCAQQGQGEQALDCFERMRREGICPDAVTYSCVLKACGSLGAAGEGERIHDEITRQGMLCNNPVIGGALVDMYAKCGALERAQRVLDELPSCDVVSWSSLIAGYAQQGQGEQAIACFERMQREGIPPNVVTLCSVLNVCNHLGLVEDGYTFFENMSAKYGVKPNSEAYTCMIDLFGRAGHLERAVKLVREMATSDYPAVWHTMLGACLKWGDVKVGRWAFEQALQVDKTDGAIYVLMANIYAAAGMEESAKRIEAMGRDNQARNKPEHSPQVDVSKDLRTPVMDTKLV